MSDTPYKRKYFTIHRNDAGTEAYDDSYVEWLEAELAAAMAEVEGLNKQLVSCAYMFDFIRYECDWEEGQDCTGDERIGDVCLKASEQIKQAMEESK